MKVMKKKDEKRKYDPQKNTGEKKPVQLKVIPREVSDKYSRYPSAGLTPVRLAQIFRAADEGDVRAQMELFEEVEEKDTHISSQMQTRKLAVTELDWNIQAASDSDFDKAVADFVQKQMEHIFSESDIMMDMLDAIGKGISVSEIAWDVDAQGRNVIERVEWVHPKKLIWDAITDEMQICTLEYPAGVPLPRNKFVVHRYKARSGHASRAGLLRSVTWMYLFKNYDLKDWVSFAEVFGMPVRLGKYNSTASEEDKKSLMEAIVSIGTDAAGITADTTDITFIESNKTATAQIYEQLARYCDEQNSKAILGQTLTADSGGGSYAQGKVHSEVRHDLTKADAHALEIIIKRDLIAPLVYYNFGPNVTPPALQFDAESPDDLKETAEIYKTLAVDLHLPISQEHVYQKFSVPKPESGEAVLQIPAAPPAEDMDAPHALKENGPALSPEQKQVDQMADAAAAQADEIFGKMFEPVIKLVGKTDSLPELKNILSSKEHLKQLYEDMDTDGLTELLQQGTYLAELIGRAQE